MLQTDTATDTSGVGITFAVPIDAAKSIMKLALQSAVGVPGAVGPQGQRA